MQSQPRDLTILVGAAIAVVILTIAGAVLAPPEPAAELRASTFGADAAGAKAAYLLLQRLGYDVQRSFVPLAELSADPRATILIIASPAVPFAAADRRTLERFVRDGGMVLAAGATRSVLPDLKDAPVDSFLDDQDAPVAAQPSAPSSASIRSTSVSFLQEATASDVVGPYVPVLAAGRTPMVLAARIGKGRVIWWAGSSPMLNGAIQSPGHLELLLDSIGPVGGRRILWDEYSHGHGRAAWSYVAATPLPAALLQALLIGLLALSRYGRRFTPIRMMTSEPRTSPLEFVDAIGVLYRRRRAASGAVETSAERARRLVCSATGLPVGTSDDRIAAASSRVALDPASVEALFEASRVAADDPNLADRKALTIVQGLQGVSAAVERPRGRSAG